MKICIYLALFTEEIVDSVNTGLTLCCDLDTVVSDVTSRDSINEFCCIIYAYLAVREVWKLVNNFANFSIVSVGGKIVVRK